MLGTSSDGPSPIKLAMSRDAGATWDPADAAILFNGTNGTGYETGPTPSLVANGRVYRAMEHFRKPFVWGVDYEAVVVSAPVDAATDLLDPRSWRISAPLPFDISWVPVEWRSKMSAPGYLEGNVVLGPDGRTVYNILRFNTRPGVMGNHAVVLRYDEQANVLVFVAVIDLPGGHSKFVIRRDMATASGLYLTLSNPNTDPAYEDQRNILALCASKDMFNWTVVATLLMDDTGFQPQDSVRYTGFHYTFWQFDGPSDGDVIYSVRTAYRGSESYHNSNRITFKTIQGWRSLVRGISSMTTSPWPMTPPYARDEPAYVVYLPQGVTTVVLSVAALVDPVAVDGVGLAGRTNVSLHLSGDSTAHTVTVGSGPASSTSISSASSVASSLQSSTSYTIRLQVAKVDPAPAQVTVTGKGFAAKPFAQGALAYSDRTYTWTDVPPQLAHGFTFTEIAGGAPAGSVAITAETVTAGFVAVATGDSSMVAKLQSEGWAADAALSFHYTDAGRTLMRVLHRTVVAGVTLAIPQGGWTGCVLLATF